MWCYIHTEEVGHDHVCALRILAILCNVWYIMLKLLLTLKGRDSNYKRFSLEYFPTLLVESEYGAWQASLSQSPQNQMQSIGTSFHIAAN